MAVSTFSVIALFTIGAVLLLAVLGVVLRKFARADTIDQDSQTHDTPEEDTGTRETPPGAHGPRPTRRAG